MAAALPRPSFSMPSCSSTSGSGDRKPIASSTRSAGCSSSVPGTRANGGVPLFSAQWIFSIVPLAPEKCVVEMAKSRVPPSLRAYEPRNFIGQRGHGVIASGRLTGGSPTSSICVTDAAPSRSELATQSAPVSPPPTTITCLPAAEMTSSAATAGTLPCGKGPNSWATQRLRW